MSTSRFIVYLVVSFLLASPVLARAPIDIKPSPLDQSNQISKELWDWNAKQKLPLEKHQILPTDYLEKNPDIKGLIINHWLGTGKTLLSIGFAERNPERSVVILAPGFLEGHWSKELEKYGVKDKSRYRFVRHDSPESLVKEELSNTIVILDESHKFVEKVRSQEHSAVYAPLYLHLRSAHRILALTGTPIYNDAFDLVYQINLVAGKDEFPFNQEEFRTAFSKVNAFKAYWRGHLLGSIYLARVVAFPIVSFVALYFGVDPMIVAPLAAASMGIPELLNALLPTSPPIRAFHPEKLAAVMQKYISYYTFEHDSSFYPKQYIRKKKLAYNDAQLDILYRFYDSRLREDELKQLFKDDATSGGKNSVFQTENCYLNSSLVQDLYKMKPWAGREIGNLSFIKKSALDKANQSKQMRHETKMLEKVNHQHIIYPDKFKYILKTIEGSKGPVVVYSHYYENGLLLFKQFLDTVGYQGKYRIFHPKLPKEKHIQIVDAYNKNQFKILLLHPDITEGISLKGTRQLYFLEVPDKDALQKQVIGRAVRYQSHRHLTSDEQKVEIYIPRYVLSTFDVKSQIALRKNWHHNFSEINYYNAFGSGRMQVDKNSKIKSHSPDTNTYIYLQTNNKQISDFVEYLKVYSIENAMYRKVKA
jgi:hypothetical protein